MQCCRAATGVREMGVFARWPVFEKPEVVLERWLQENPVYPFQEETSGTSESTAAVYSFSTRFKRFYLALASTAATLLFIMIWPSAGGDNEYLVFATMAFALSVYLSVEYYSVRTIVLDTANHHYSVYRGTMLTTTQHCHNIYIRLLCHRSVSRHPTYRLVLDGYGLELPVRLAGETTHRKKLRHLGHQLAANLKINYFDIHNSSKHLQDIIRHYRPHMVPQEHHED